MLSYSQAFYHLSGRLQQLYEQQEAIAISHEVLFHITKLDKVQRLLGKDTLFTADQQVQYDHMLQQLENGRPLQYVVGEAWFMGRLFKVDENVLIPRPETEELVQWIIDDTEERTACTILDIGTGSGCIPISLKLAMPFAGITSCDISAEALGVAHTNMSALHVDVQFLHLDFLNQKERGALPMFDVIISNPPYIPISEKESLHKNVRDYEPAQALFVPDNDALIFYRVIAEFGKEHLNTNGAIYCELHVDYAMHTKALFEMAGYSTVEIRKDVHGNLRMLKAAR